ncbi:MAG: DnaD domain protein [Christensenellales bacterium]
MYSKVESRFWDDEKVLALSCDGRYLMLYLLTSKHRNLIGCYRLPRSYAREDMGLPQKRFSAAWNELLTTGMVGYDCETKTVLLKNYLRHNPIDGPKQAAGAITRLSALPDSPLLLELLQQVERELQKGKACLKPLFESLARRLEIERESPCAGGAAGESSAANTMEASTAQAGPDSNQAGKTKTRRKRAAENRNEPGGESPIERVCPAPGEWDGIRAGEDAPIAENRKQKTGNREREVVVDSAAETGCAQPLPHPLPPYRDKETARLIALYKANHSGAYCTPVVAARIAQSAEKSGAELVETALLHCAGLGKKPWGYIEKCLGAWEQQGLHTKAEVELHEKKRISAAKPPASRQDSAFFKYMRHDYDYDALENLFELPKPGGSGDNGSETDGE